MLWLFKLKSVSWSHRRKPGQRSELTAWAEGSDPSNITIEGVWCWQWNYPGEGIGGQTVQANKESWSQVWPGLTWVCTPSGSGPGRANHHLQTLQWKWCQRLFPVHFSTSSLWSVWGRSHRRCKPTWQDGDNQEPSWSEVWLMVSLEHQEEEECFYFIQS